MGIHHKFILLYVVLGIVFGSNHYGKYICILEKQKKKKTFCLIVFSFKLSATKTWVSLCLEWSYLK